MQFPFKLDLDREFDVVGFGTNAVDYLIEVPNYPEFNSKVELNEYVRAAGGEIATTMVGLRRIGLKTAYVGRFGDDAAGEFGLGSLTAEGVDTSYAECIAGARTQIAFIIIDARNGERTVIWKRDPKLSYTKDEAPIDVVSRASVLHFTPHDVAAAISLAAEAKRIGTVVSIDVDNLFEGIEELLPLVDILIASAEFPSRLLGIDDYRNSLPEMAARYGCGVCGVTLGEMGSLIFSQDTFVETPAFKVPGGCRDTTGAGDAYRVGIIYGMIRGSSIEGSARLANGVAALKCRSLGARTALPTETDLLAFLDGKAHAL